MGQGEEVKTRSDPQIHIQERDEIFFFYRPKVNREAAHGLDDVQRCYIVLRPESTDKPLQEKQDPQSGKEGAKDATASSSSSSSSSTKDPSAQGERGSQEVNIEKESLMRFVVMGRKSLPHPRNRSQPYWAFVELVTTNINDVKTALQGEEYDTSTRGLRHKYPARALGEGVYRILKHNPDKRSMHTHLVYKLEFPLENKQDDEPQQSLDVEREASLIVQIKNPEQSAGGSQFRGIQNRRKAVFPAHLQGQLGHKKFGPADPPDFLNYEGCEFLLISASDDIEDELGMELKTECEAGDPCCSDLMKTFGDSVPASPLLGGTWA